MKKLALILTAFLLLTPALAEAKKKPKKPSINGPSTARFYNPPKSLYKGPPGSLVWQRPSKSFTRISNAGFNRHIIYRSKTAKGAASVVSGMVSIPKGKPPRGGWPVISWAHGTTGLADVCAPSREVGNLAIEYGHSGLNQALFRRWIASGYAIVRTDYEGLGTPGKHPYLVGKSAARSLIEIVPAARALSNRLGSPISGKVTLAGHSQGGHGVLFAAGLFSNYKKPGMTLEKTVSYAPASHLSEQGTVLLYSNENTPGFGQPSSLSALATMILLGAASDNESLRINQILSDSALQYLPDTEKICLPQLGQANKLGGIAPYALFRSRNGLEPLFATLDKMNPTLPIKSPTLIVQGDQDTTVQPVFTNLLSNKLNNLSVPLEYETIAGADHGSILEAANPVVDPFLGISTG